jgi:hypothetical protein
MEKTCFNQINKLEIKNRSYTPNPNKNLYSEGLKKALIRYKAEDLLFRNNSKIKFSLNKVLGETDIDKKKDINIQDLLLSKKEVKYDQKLFLLNNSFSKYLKVSI